MTAPIAAAYWQPSGVRIVYLDGSDMLLPETPATERLAAEHAQWAERAEALMAEFTKRA